MRKIGNRLLITLVLFGVLSAAAAHAQSSSIRLGRAPTNPIDWRASGPQATPNSGEPDVGATSPQKTNVSPLVRVDSRQGSSTSLQKLFAAQSRWAWVMWMAWYLNLPF